MGALDELLSGIVADPGEETRWLVLADWLEEHDDPRRGELLRLHRRLVNTCCAPDAHPDRAAWQARLVQLLAAGVRPAAIEVLRHRRPSADLQPREALIVDTIRALYQEHRLTDELYRRAEAEFGRAGLVELVVLAGYYGLIGFVLNAFEADLPPGTTSAFPR